MRADAEAWSSASPADRAAKEAVERLRKSAAERDEKLKVGAGHGLGVGVWEGLGGEGVTEYPPLSTTQWRRI